MTGDHDPPELIDFRPTEGTDLRGVSQVSTWVVYRDAHPVTARVFVDGELIGEAPSECGDSTCQASLTWDTTAFPPGVHDLSVSLEDSSGNVSSATHPVVVDDVLAITAMRLTGVVDQSGTLEIEVYAFDEQDRMIGCAGSRHGLSIVDNSGIDYQTDAVLITPVAMPLPFSTGEVGSGKFRLEVWEDDDEPVCPAELDPLGNDFVGKSPMLTVDEWRTLPVMAFDSVAKLGVQWTRELAEGETVDPPLVDNDPWSGGDTCQASRGSAGLILVALAFGLRRRRRHQVKRYSGGI